MREVIIALHSFACLSFHLRNELNIIWLGQAIGNLSGSPKFSLPLTPQHTLHMWLHWISDWACRQWLPNPSLPHQLNQLKTFWLIISTSSIIEHFLVPSIRMYLLIIINPEIHKEVFQLISFIQTVNQAEWNEITNIW